MTSLQNSPLTILQLTDIHLCDDPDQQLYGINTEQSWKAVLSLVKTVSSPDLLLLTGDLTQEGGKLAYYRLQQEIAALEIPAYYLPGNHDDIPTMESLFDEKWLGINRSVLVGNWHLVLLNSAVAGQVEGHLGSKACSWLKEILEEKRNYPTLIALHHPPVVLGCPWIDGTKLTDAEVFWEICTDHPQIKAVIAGHAHQAYDAFSCPTNKNIRCLVSPSTCAQFQPGSVTFALDQSLPGFRSLTLFPDGHLETRVDRLSYLPGATF